MTRHLLLACGVLLALGVLTSPASAGVSSFDAATGTPTPGFVKLQVGQRPDALIPDGRGGLFVAGRKLTAAGRRVTLVHLRPDGTVDPAFHATIDNGAALGGAAHAGLLALIGDFARIDGKTRRDLAILDARTGRLERWAPELPTPASRGTIGASVAFAGGRLLASSVDRVTAWRLGVARRDWSRTVSHGAAGAPELLTPAGRTLLENGSDLVQIHAATGATVRSLGEWTHTSSLSVAGASVWANVQGLWTRVGARSGSACLQPPDGAASDALTGDAGAIYIASSTVDADRPDARDTITACTPQGRPLPGFTTQALPVHGPLVIDLALVGTHLVAFTI